MDFYLAPLEGITGYLYRQCVARHFGDAVDKYFTPFLVPHVKRSFTKKEADEIAPEHNQGLRVIPQVMVNDPFYYFEFEKDMLELGYEEIDLNLGCPSGTVVSKGRGSGFLADPTALDRFLDEVYSKTKLKLSIKTRIGVDDPEEFEDLLKIYRKYPIEELIIHPRVRKEFYDGRPHRDAFFKAYEVIDVPICYNGDIYAKEDLDQLQAEAAEAGVTVDRVMIGRGMIADPGLIRELKGGPAATKQELKSFLDDLLENYIRVMHDDMTALFRAKEIWSYMICQFPGEEKAMKRIRKAKRFSEYQAAVEELLR